METGLKKDRLWISVWVSGVVVLLRMRMHCPVKAAKGVTARQATIRPIRSRSHRRLCALLRVSGYASLHWRCYGGYRATCHWSSIDQLSLLGVEPVQKRVVRDRNRITGAGVTSGIDFALTVVADLVGHQAAQEIQLQMEYDPAPPYQAGSPRTAPSALTEAIRQKNSSFIEQRRSATKRAAEYLANPLE